MTVDRTKHCCLCGAMRRPPQAPVEVFRNHDLPLLMKDHRPLGDGRWEHSPQLCVNVSLYRNGGVAPGQTHMCDDCIVVGLRQAKAFVDGALEALERP